MIDKTGLGNGLVEAGLSILAVTAHLQMIVIRDKRRIRLHFRQDNRNNRMPVDIGAFSIDTRAFVL